MLSSVGGELAELPEHPENKGSFSQGQEDVFEEGELIEVEILLAVEVGEELAGNHFLFLEILIEIRVREAESGQQKGSENGIVQGHVPVVVEVLPREQVVVGEVVLNADEDQVFVEELDDHLGVLVVERPPELEEQQLEKLEFGDGQISRVSGVVSLLSHDPDPDVRLLNHVDVVLSISNGEHFDSEFLEQSHDVHLLVRIGSAKQNALKLPQKLIEKPLGLGVAQGDLQHIVVHHQALEPLLFQLLILHGVYVVLRKVHTHGLHCMSSHELLLEESEGKSVLFLHCFLQNLFRYQSLKKQWIKIGK